MAVIGVFNENLKVHLYRWEGRVDHSEPIFRFDITFSEFCYVTLYYYCDLVMWLVYNKDHMSALCSYDDGLELLYM